jgi:DNA repair protein RadA/Sms
MGRPESRYVCQGCGASTLRWEGQCRACGDWNSLVETLVRPVAHGARRSAASAGRPTVHAVPLSAITGREVARRAIGLDEVDRVLGGGLVPGSLVLLGGEPGIGKSTLVLEIAAGIAAAARHPGGRAGGGVLYASGEESAAQSRLRAERLGLVEGAAGERIHILAETDLETILSAAGAMAPDLLIIDSIQTLTTEGMEGPAGSVGQVREATARLQAFAKYSDVPVILVGHVTKDGSLAGPKTLEHLVDAVLTLEGERFGSVRLLRATKNRFGSTEEIGVLEMTRGGLRQVADPERAFLGQAAGSGASGVAVAAGSGGSRPLLIEIQALVAPVGYGTPRRTVAGLDANRLALLVAVLGRRAGVSLASHDIYASVAGGLVVEEPAIDLPIALALASSARDRPLLGGTVSCGEIGLLGELRPVVGLERRLREASRLGFRRAIVPAADADPRRAPVEDHAMFGSLEVVTAGTLREALAVALGAVPDPSKAVVAEADAGPGIAADAVLGSPLP